MVTRSTPASEKIARALGGDAVRRWGAPQQDVRDEAEAEARASEPRRAAPQFDFSRVRIHADGEADALAGDLGAAAFTRGRDIYFRNGAWRPGTRVGDRLLAHELTHVAQQERSGAAAIQCYSDADILPALEQPVTAGDTKAQRERVERLAAVFRELAMWEAADVLKRITTRKRGDKLAAEFHYRLSTKSRERLVTILRERAAKLPLTEVSKPSDDPKFVDNVVDQGLQVLCYLIVADRYTLKWPGGQKTVYNAEIDWTRKSHALPLLNVYGDQASALAAAAEWRKDVKGYDQVVAYYRGPAGVILPTWISPETAPRTYDLIMGVNADVRHELLGWQEAFRGIRNGMIVGMVLGGALRVFGIRFGGGGSVPDVPSGGPGRMGSPDIDPAPPGGAGKPPTADVPAAEPPGAAAQPEPPIAGATKPPTSEPVAPEHVTAEEARVIKPGTAKEPEPGTTAAPAPRLSIRERLTRYYQRLSAKPPARTADDGLRQVSDTLDEVEDQFSGVPKRNPPPPPRENDGRMYPPLSDNIIRHADGSITAVTRGHRINIGSDGSITITSIKTGQVEFKKP